MRLAVEVSARIEDRQDPVPDGVRQERDHHHAQHREGGDQLGLPQKHQHHHGTGHANPAGPGVGHAQSQHTHGKHAAGRHAGDAPLGAEDQRQYQGQQEDQHLCKGVGVVEIGLHPAGHTGVDLQVHIGLVDLHALDPLVHTVQRGHQHTDPTAGGQPLQILCAPGQR